MAFWDWIEKIAAKQYRAGKDVIPIEVTGSTVHQNMYVNRGFVNVGKSAPLYQYFEVSIPGSTTTLTEFVVATVPTGKAWLIATVVVQTSANGVVDTVILDGNKVGCWTGSSGYTKCNLKDWFGDFVLTESQVAIEAMNSGASAETQAVSLYGWEVTL